MASISLNNAVCFFFKHIIKGEWCYRQSKIWEVIERQRLRMIHEYKRKAPLALSFAILSYLGRHQGLQGNCYESLPFALFLHIYFVLCFFVHYLLSPAWHIQLLVPLLRSSFLLKLIQHLLRSLYMLRPTWTEVRRSFIECVTRVYSWDCISLTL